MVTSQMPVTERPRRSADGTRTRILAAAVDEFADRSFDGASTRSIAARAGVTQPLLNYHFHTKDELWRSAVDGLFATLTTALGDRLDGLRGTDDTTVTRLLVREFVEFSARNPQLHRIMTGECKTDGPRMDYLVDRHIAPLYEMTTERFSRLVDAGVMPPVAPAHLYYLLTGAGPTMFVLGPECRRLTGLDPTDDDVIAAHADAVCTLLFGPQAGESHAPRP
jgi:TetR/AcrR family transcriptional regulator